MKDSQIVADISGRGAGAGGRGCLELARQPFLPDQNAL